MPCAAANVGSNMAVLLQPSQFLSVQECHCTLKSNQLWPKSTAGGFPCCAASFRGCTAHLGTSARGCLPC